MVTLGALRETKPELFPAEPPVVELPPLAKDERVPEEQLNSIWYIANRCPSWSYSAMDIVSSSGDAARETRAADRQTVLKLVPEVSKRSPHLGEALQDLLERTDSVALETIWYRTRGDEKDASFHDAVVRHLQAHRLDACGRLRDAVRDEWARPMRDETVIEAPG